MPAASRQCVAASPHSRVSMLGDDGRCLGQLRAVCGSPGSDRRRSRAMRSTNVSARCGRTAKDCTQARQSKSPWHVLDAGEYAVFHGADTVNTLRLLPPARYDHRLKEIRPKDGCGNAGTGAPSWAVDDHQSSPGDDDHQWSLRDDDHQSSSRDDEYQRGRAMHSCRIGQQDRRRHCMTRTARQLTTRARSEVGTPRTNSPR